MKNMFDVQTEYPCHNIQNSDSIDYLVCERSGTSDEDDNISDAAKEIIHNFDDIQDVLLTKSDVQICNVTKIHPIQSDLMKKLLFACNEDDSSDVIVIIGNISSAGRHLVTEAIENVRNSKEISRRVARSLLNITMRLNEIMPHNKTACGIRNHTLIVNLSGAQTNTKEFFEAIIEMILQTTRLIYADMNQDSLDDVASTSGVNFTKQKEAGSDDVKHPKRAISPVDLLSSNESVIKRLKIQFPMISIKDALFKIREVINESKDEIICETVQLENAYGRILYENVEAIYNLPPFKTATKHGYAVMVADGKILREVLNSYSMSPWTSLEPETCMWVDSGAPVPNNATAVVPINNVKEVTRPESSSKMYIQLLIEPQYEENIKPIGYDLTEGNTVATRFTYIGPIEIGLLAASGRKEVLVVKNKSIGVLSIGDNLMEIGESLIPGFLYDANRITLISLLKAKGFDPLDFGIVDNKMASIQNRIEEALKKVDILVTTGSTNDRDLMKTILEKYYKADIHFGNVHMKPGKSTIFATCKIDNAKKYFLCLPGNPVSAFTAAQVFLVPLVKEMSFSSKYITIPVRMEHQYTLHSRPRMAWTIVEWTEDHDFALACTRGNAITDKLISASGANALLILPEKRAGKMPPKSFAQALIITRLKKFNNKYF